MTRDSRLVEWGVQNEGSDWRVHVCPIGGREKAAFFFPTASAIKALGPSVPGKWSGAKQKGVDGDTGYGKRVPWEFIDDCHVCHPPGWVWTISGWGWRMSTSEKGRAAQTMVMAVLENGYVPVGVPFCVKNLKSVYFTAVNRHNMGHDISIWGPGGHWKLEVKCDLPGLKRGPYLQTAERNPLGRH